MAAGARGKPDEQTFPTSKAMVESLALFLCGMITTHLKGVKQQVRNQIKKSKKEKNLTDFNGSVWNQETKEN